MGALDDITADAFLKTSEGNINLTMVILKMHQLSHLRKPCCDSFELGKKFSLITIQTRNTRF